MIVADCHSCDSATFIDIVHSALGRLDISKITQAIDYQFLIFI
jgi:hypothetical protein